MVINSAGMSLKPSVRPSEIQLCINRLCETNSGSAHILERYISQLECMLVGNAKLLAERIKGRQDGLDAAAKLCDMAAAKHEKTGTEVSRFAISVCQQRASDIRAMNPETIGEN